MRCLPAVLLSFVLIVGVLNSCSHDAVSSNGENTTHRSDTIHDTIHSGKFDSTSNFADTTSNGFVWTLMSTPSENRLDAVWISSPFDIYAFGNSIYRFDGTKWDIMQCLNQSNNRIGFAQGGGV